MRILFVEDDVDLVDVARMALRKDDCELVAASGLVEAFAKLRNERFQAIIADVNLRDGDGLDLVAKASVPCIVMSGDALAECDARASGAVAFLLKPVGLKGLRNAIAELRAVCAQQDRAEAPPDPARVVDR